MTQAWLYDGVTGVRQQVGLTAGAAVLRLGFVDGRTETVTAADLRAGDRRPDVVVVGRAGVKGWRLSVPQPIPADLAALLPTSQGYGRWIEKVGLWPAAGLAGALSAVVLAIGYFAPAWLTPVVPQSWEREFGEALVGDFGGEFCTGDGGARALAKLAAQLDRNARELNIRVVDLGMVNAAALPGGNIVIFRGLIGQAKGPDEVAGVLAHEIAHVRERHVTEAMLRHFGVGLLVTTLGGSTGANIESALSLSYGRGAEREADAEAIKSLNRAAISPLPTARFFGSLAKEESGLGRFEGAAAYLSSHPASRERQQRFAASANPARRYRPALSDAEWKALRRICAPPAKASGTS